MRVNVAIDGPAGAGKSTIARLLAKEFNLMYINTGAMYRAVTLEALQKHIEPEDIIGLEDLIKSLDMHFIGDDLVLNGEVVMDRITDPIISKNVSKYAAIPEVRERLVFLQKLIAEKYDVVMDGRDIGTVVLKEAPFKFYLTASAEERAKRRYEELVNRNIVVDYEEILQDIIKRDYIDINRVKDPLKKAVDAIEIDSTSMSIHDVVKSMAEIIRKSLMV